MEGRKPSIWDTFVMDHPEKILDHSNGDVAIDFYFRYKEDIALMKEVGMDSFRFSISWSRILPNGKISGGVNQQGVAFYDNLIDHLISNGIEPFITLFHWDLPQALNDEYGGFLSPKIVKDFGDFVDFCFKQFGDRVKQWVTLNEPNLFTKGGYAAGTNAPGRCSNYIGNCTAGNSATEPYAVAHHLILCHATAVKLYKEKYQASQKGLIGITLYTFWAVPKFQTVASRDAATRALDFMFGWFFNPITYGDYPKIMRELVGDRLPKFTNSQSKMVKGSIDFLGFNYYSANYADGMTYYSNANLSYTTDNRVNLTTEKNGIPIGQQTGASWIYLYPKGIREILLYIKRKYNSPIIYITENGMADVENSISRPIDNALNDSLRIKYHRLHLSHLLKAINKDGVDVRRYYVWSFLDNFEWSSGYTLRFGITYVDYKDGLKRSFKKSALWFRSFLQKQNNIVSSTAASLKLYSDQ
ncbi:putative Beta-glucosidase [Melia azedarach]|uniref:Beta-glucosidase n=1 Tax=Melia azedarach TaxID=155640 RepID=A0ACC1XL82_MELAZ|nr:putative Beta-glucosidase [Melia azedarach]